MSRTCALLVRPADGRKRVEQYIGIADSRSTFA